MGGEGLAVLAEGVYGVFAGGFDGGVEAEEGADDEGDIEGGGEDLP